MTIDELISHCGVDEMTLGPNQFPVDRIKSALSVILHYGGIDGEHHKTWVIDQVARYLAGDHYEELVRMAKDGADGPDTYGWETGIAP